MLIDFRQFLLRVYDSVEKVLFKADFIFFFFFFFCMTELQRQTLTHNLNIHVQHIYNAHVHNAMVQCIINNLNILEMKQVLELQPFIPNATWLNI